MLKVLFPFSDPELTKVRSHLARKFRTEIVEEAAKAGVSFITTFGQTEKEYYEFFRSVRDSVEKHGGEVIFIQLAPSKEALLSRVESDSRKGVKLDSREIFEKLLDEHEGFWTSFPDVDHLKIDNSNLTPTKTTYNKKKTAKMPTGPVARGTECKTNASPMPAMMVPIVIAFANIFHIVA
jgi:hypothetical protein